MPLDFINDPRWNDLDSTVKSKMIDAAFNDDVASDPRFSSLTDEQKSAFKNAYTNDALSYEKSLQPVPDDSILGAARTGISNAIDSGKAITDVLLNDEAGARNAARKMSLTPSTESQQRFESQVQENNKGQDYWWSNFKGVISAAAKEPTGFAHSIVSQIPNSIPSMVSMATGAAVGGAVGGPVAPVTAIAGGIIGLFAGNTFMEGGEITANALNQSGSTFDREKILKDSATKGAYTAAADLIPMVITGGVGKAMFGPAMKASTSAMNKALVSKGINYLDNAAVDAALTADRALAKEIKAIGEAAAKPFLPSKKALAGLFVAETGMDMAGETFGEYKGNIAIGNEPDVSGAILEGVASLGQGVGHAAIATSVGKSFAAAKDYISKDDVTTPPPGILNATTPDEAIAGFEAEMAGILSPDRLKPTMADIASKREGLDMATEILDQRRRTNEPPPVEPPKTIQQLNDAAMPLSDLEQTTADIQAEQDRLQALTEGYQDPTVKPPQRTPVPVNMSQGTPEEIVTDPQVRPILRTPVPVDMTRTDQVAAPDVATQATEPGTAPAIETPKQPDTAVLPEGPEVDVQGKVSNTLHLGAGIGASQDVTLTAQHPLEAEAKKYKSVEEFKARGFEAIQKDLFGVSNDDVVTVPTSQIKIKWKDDLKNAQETARDTYDSKTAEPVDLIFDIKTGKYILDDGHNRYVAAKRSGVPLKGIVQHTEGNMDDLANMYEKKTGQKISNIWERAHGVAKETSVAKTPSGMPDGSLKTNNIDDLGKLNSRQETAPLGRPTIEVPRFENGQKVLSRKTVPEAVQEIKDNETTINRLKGMLDTCL